MFVTKQIFVLLHVLVSPKMGGSLGFNFWAYRRAGSASGDGFGPRIACPLAGHCGQEMPRNNQPWPVFNTKCGAIAVAIKAFKVPLLSSVLGKVCGAESLGLSLTAAI
jgi:hypothetical protein